ncbi:uncharacterized protein GJ701_004791 [Geothlypis trichas]
MFGVEITDEEFELLLDRIPLDEDGNVKHPQFMLRFDSWKLSSISVVEDRTSRSVVLLSAAMCLSNCLRRHSSLYHSRSDFSTKGSCGNFSYSSSILSGAAQPNLVKECVVGALNNQSRHGTSIELEETK